MTWYLCFVMNGVKNAALFGIILSALYAVMYLLLQSSGKTFLIGSVISFIALAAVGLGRQVRAVRFDEHAV